MQLQCLGDQPLLALPPPLRYQVAGRGAHYGLQFHPVLHRQKRNESTNESTTSSYTRTKLGARTLHGVGTRLVGWLDGYRAVLDTVGPCPGPGSECDRLQPHTNPRCSTTSRTTFVLRISKNAQDSRRHSLHIIHHKKAVSGIWPSMPVTRTRTMTAPGNYDSSRIGYITHMEVLRDTSP